MQYTNNLKLRKPEGTDPVKIEDINANMDKIDESLAGYPGFIIAPADAVNKERADLVLTGTNDAQAINDVFTMLHNKRGGDSNIAIRIDFMGGNIELDDDTQILLEYDNFHIYGNGVRIEGDIGDENWETSYGILHVQGEDCKLSDIYTHNKTWDYGFGIYASNSTLTNCTGSSDHGPGIYTSNSTLTNCIGNSSDSAGIDVSNSTLTNCTGSSDYGPGIYASNESIIQACDGTEGGIFVDNSCKPNTLELLQQFNKGAITIR